MLLFLDKTHLKLKEQEESGSEAYVSKKKIPPIKIALKMIYPLLKDQN